MASMDLISHCAFEMSLGKFGSHYGKVQLKSVQTRTVSDVFMIILW